MAQAQIGSGGRVRAAILVALAFVLPLVMVPALQDAFQTPKAALLSSVTFLLVFARIASTIGSEAVAWRRTAFDLPVLALLIAGGISWLFSSIAYLSGKALLMALSYAALFFLVKESDAGTVRALLWAALAAGGAVASLAVGEQCNLRIIRWAREFDPRRTIISTIGSAQFVALYLAPLPAVALGLVWNRKGLVRWAGLILGLLAAVVVALTTTRLAFLACGSSLILFVLAVRGMGRPGRLVQYGIVVITIVLLAAAPLGLWGSRAVRERLLTWRVSLSMIKARPWIGWGPGTYTFEYPLTRARMAVAGAIPADAPGSVDGAHNDYLQALAETGLAGGVAMLLLLSVTARACVRTFRAAEGSDRPLVAGMAAGIWALAFSAGAHFPAHVVPVAALGCILVGGIARLDPASCVRAMPPSRLSRPWRIVIAEVVFILTICAVMAHGRLCAAQFYERKARDFLAPDCYDLCRAEDSLLRARAADPRDGLIRSQLGQVLYSAGYFDEALRELRASLASYSDAYAYLLIGRCLDQTGDPAAARRARNRAFAMDPQTKSVAHELGDLP